MFHSVRRPVAQDVYDCKIAWSIIFTYLFIKFKSLLFNVRNCFDLYYLNARIKWILIPTSSIEGRCNGRMYIDFTMATKTSFDHEKSSAKRWLQQKCISNSIKFYNYSCTLTADQHVFALASVNCIRTTIHFMWHICNARWMCTLYSVHTF